MLVHNDACSSAAGSGGEGTVYTMETIKAMETTTIHTGWLETKRSSSGGGGGGENNKDSNHLLGSGSGGGGGGMLSSLSSHLHLPGHHRGQRWRRRFFVVKGHYLLTFKDEDEARCALCVSRCASRCARAGVFV
jgi:hypothetical protein